ncbi:hypothetical protein ACI3PL_28025, partial [Lacticaseibacillus paracasei]
MKLNADMNIGQFNTGQENQFGMQQNTFSHAEQMQLEQFAQRDKESAAQFAQEVKMFGLNSALQLQMQRI